MPSNHQSEVLLKFCARVLLCSSTQKEDIISMGERVSEYSMSRQYRVGGAPYGLKTVSNCCYIVFRRPYAFIGIQISVFQRLPLAIGPAIHLIACYVFARVQAQGAT